MAIKQLLANDPVVQNAIKQERTENM